MTTSPNHALQTCGWVKDSFVAHRVFYVRTLLCCYSQGLGVRQDLSRLRTCRALSRGYRVAPALRSRVPSDVPEGYAEFSRHGDGRFVTPTARGHSQAPLVLRGNLRFPRFEPRRELVNLVRSQSRIERVFLEDFPGSARRFLLAG